MKKLLIFIVFFFGIGINQSFAFDTGYVQSGSQNQLISTQNFQLGTDFVSPYSGDTYSIYAIKGFDVNRFNLNIYKNGVFYKFFGSFYLYSAYDRDGIFISVYDNGNSLNISIARPTGNSQMQLHYGQLENTASETAGTTCNGASSNYYCNVLGGFNSVFTLSSGSNNYNNLYYYYQQDFGPPDPVILNEGTFSYTNSGFTLSNFETNFDGQINFGVTKTNNLGIKTTEVNNENIFFSGSTEKDFILQNGGYFPENFFEYGYYYTVYTYIYIENNYPNEDFTLNSFSFDLGDGFLNNIGYIEKTASGFSLKGLNSQKNGIIYFYLFDNTEYVKDEYSWDNVFTGSIIEETNTTLNFDYNFKIGGDYRIISKIYYDDYGFDYGPSLIFKNLYLSNKDNGFYELTQTGFLLKDFININAGEISFYVTNLDNDTTSFLNWNSFNGGEKTTFEIDYGSEWINNTNYLIESRISLGDDEYYGNEFRFKIENGIITGSGITDTHISWDYTNFDFGLGGCPVPIGSIGEFEFSIFGFGSFTPFDSFACLFSVALYSIKPIDGGYFKNFVNIEGGTDVFEGVLTDNDPKFSNSSLGLGDFFIIVICFFIFIGLIKKNG